MSLFHLMDTVMKNANLPRPVSVGFWNKKVQSEIDYLSRLRILARQTQERLMTESSRHSVFVITSIY